MYLVLVVAGLASLYLVGLLFSRSSSRASLPPGPKPLPIVGNVRDMPAFGSPDWAHWLEHKALYGPISTVSVLGQRLIILNDVRLAFELLEKKSVIYSDRPKLPFASLCGLDGTVLMQGYGKRLKAYRKYIHRELGSSLSASRFNQTQETEVRRFLVCLLDAPQHLPEHAKRLAGAMILKVLYGYRMDYTALDPLLDFIEKTLENTTAALVPGTWLVDAVPILRHVPAWFPGAGFRLTAQLLWQDLQSMADVPFRFVQEQINVHSVQGSYVANLLKDRDIPSGSKEETDVKWTAVSLYFGGADTTVSTISSFYLAMALYPDVQKRAQEEIDRVVGRDRLPGYEDRDNLPYINALVKEALRWHPVTPMGVAHSSMEDDVCDGYHIPKGSIIMPNIWAFCHDPKDYKDAMSFKPERFLGDNPELDPYSFAFGFGRRICPGRILADSNIYLTISMSLAAFNIGKAVRDGKEIDVQPHFLPGMISHPAPFVVSIKLRDPKYEEITRSVENEHPWETRDADMVRGMLR
ncbi:cytochrome P450 [Aspergillus undulatus]|uniref:cytochrome P450 n=1 Tax=Aspergillus undulatus TaxID=1810928 RepID=UPI003CCE3F3F